VASVDYHLATSEPFPAQIRDVRTAAWWLWKNARELEINPGRMMVAGQSAGGHLALLLAFTQGEHLKGWGPVVPHGTIRAVAALYPPTDLLRLVPPKERDNPIHPVALLLVIEGGHAFTLYPGRVKDILAFLNSVPSLKGSAAIPP